MEIAIFLIIGLAVGMAIGRFVLASPMQRKIESIERNKARLEKANEEIEIENKQFHSQLLADEKVSQQRIQELEAAYQAQIQEQKQAYQAQIEALQVGNASFSPNSEDAQIDLVEAHQSEIQHLQSSHQSEIQHLQSSHQSEIQSIEQSYQQQIHDLQFAHQSAFDELNSTHQAQIQDIQQSHQSAIRNLEATYQGQMLEIEQSHENQLQSLAEQGKNAVSSATGSVTEGFSSVMTGLTGAAAGVVAGMGLSDLLQEKEEVPVVLSEDLEDDGFNLDGSFDLPTDEFSGFSESTDITDELDLLEAPVLDLPAVSDPASLPIELEEEFSFSDFEEGDRPSMDLLPDMDESLDESLVANFDTSQLENLLNEAPELEDYPDLMIDARDDSEFMGILESEGAVLEEKSPRSFATPEFPSLEQQADPFAGLFGDQETDASDLEFLSMLETEDEALSTSDLPNLDADDPFSFGLEDDDSDSPFSGEDNSQNGSQSGLDLDTLFEELSRKDDSKVHEMPDF